MLATAVLALVAGSAWAFGAWGLMAAGAVLGVVALFVDVKE
jgi:hypothetical protein